MADARALLAAEKASRQIKHPHLTYSKNGALTCNICNLNIKSEQLWSGHQRSPAHRKNVQRTSEQPIRSAKRKIEHLEQDEDNEEQNKKQKSFEETFRIPELVPSQPPLDTAETMIIDARSLSDSISGNETRNVAENPDNAVQSQPLTHASTLNSVDEDEWAAFEREVAPLAQSTYVTATIEAAPVSAAELAEQQKSNPVQQREDEAEAEKEEESRRLEEEFEVMEEMEDRVKRLRERREALRSSTGNILSIDTDPPALIAGTIIDTADAGADSSEEDGDDEWYN